MSDPTRTRIDPADPHATRTVEPSTIPADPNATDTADTSPSAIAARPGVSVSDRYLVGAELARGGMGVVYRATDTAFGREVALKVLQEKYGTESTAAHRFHDEARITARLQHPAVPPVHDQGTLPDGRPFLAMKLIRGATLDARLKERATPAEDRGLFQGVFEAVCQAVGYAHSRGVIHRDLKPANVMVGDFGEVQVMDWGLARSLPNEDWRLPIEGPTVSTAGEADADNRHSTIDDPQFEKLTHTGSVLGTPAYMPPEQASGRTAEVGLRSDVFGLGAILAVILTGKPPFASHSAESTRQMAAAGRVDECFARLDECGAGPEWVALCKRCLSPKPTDRPADAGEVAKAVGELRQAADERARQAEQERARAEVRASELRKRRRVQTALAAVVGLLVIGGGAVAWWQERQASDRRTADLQRQYEDDRRAADEAARLGRNADAVKGLLDQTRDALAAGDLAKAVPLLDAAAKRADEGGADDQRERIADYRAEAKLLRELKAAERYRQNTGYRYVANKEVEAKAWRAALAEFGITPETTAPATAAERINAAAIREQLLSAFTYQLLGAKHPWARDVLRAADPDPFRDICRDAAFDKDMPRLFTLSVHPLMREQPLGFLMRLSSLGDQPKLDLGGKVVRVDSVTIERRRELLHQTLVKHPTDPSLLLLIAQLAPLDEKPGWYQAAVAADPTDPVAWNNLAYALLDRRQFARSVQAAREAVRLDPTTEWVRVTLGAALAHSGDLAGAEETLRESLRLDPNDVVALANLGGLHQRKGELKEAVAVCRQAIERDADLPEAHANLGFALLDLGDLKGAEAAHRKALELWPEYAHAHLGLGNVLLEKGDAKGAEAEFREAIRLNARQPDAHYNLGILLRQKGKLADAEASHREAIRLDPAHAPAYSGLGNVLRDKGDLPGAVAALKESVRLRPKYAAAHDNLGIVLAMSGDLDGAIKSFEEALRLSPTNQGTATNLGKARQMKVAKVVKQLKGWSATPTWPVPGR